MTKLSTILSVLVSGIIWTCIVFWGVVLGIGFFKFLTISTIWLYLILVLIANIVASSLTNTIIHEKIDINTLKDKLNKKSLIKHVSVFWLVVCIIKNVALSVFLFINGWFLSSFIALNIMYFYITLRYKVNKNLSLIFSENNSC